MSFLQQLADFFQNLFMGSSPEVKRKQALKKLESEMKLLSPVIYKNGMVQENFAEALRILYENTKPIHTILSETICSSDVNRNNHFTEQLLLTGFTREVQELLEELSYENRKSGAREADSLSRYFDSEHRKLEKILKHLNTPDFVRIDTVLEKLIQLHDICKFNYITALRIFDVNFSSDSGYKPRFQAIPLELLENTLQDLYFVTNGIDISNSCSNAIMALYDLFTQGNATPEQQEEIRGNLRKMQSVFKNFITEKILLNFIRIVKKAPEFQPKVAEYHANFRQTYAHYLQSRFDVDSARLKTELQDEKISSELYQIFGKSQMQMVTGYNAETNAMLMQSTPYSFTMVMPLQILKTFIVMYYEENVRQLLNDIAIEGYFNNQALKTEFSTNVYAVNEVLEHIGTFEARFSKEGDYSEEIFSNLIKDSLREGTQGGRLKDVVDRLNKNAKELIQIETNNIAHLSKQIQGIIVDSKKANSDIISNLQVLMRSSRNRANSEFLEKHAGAWETFVEIMKNYVIITNVEKK